VSEPLFADEKGDTLTPPVLRPMRSVSSMNDSFSVPICSRGAAEGGDVFWCLGGSVSRGGGMTRQYIEQPSKRQHTETTALCVNRVRCSNRTDSSPNTV
jgi:hypothetical protein